MYLSSMGMPVKVAVFVDSDLATNYKDHCLITGLIVCTGCTPYKWSSKRQTCIATSTYGIEFAALHVAVEETIAIINTLKSVGVPILGCVCILCDNKSVTDNATISGSPLKYKHTSIAYHKVRECTAKGLRDLYYIKGKDSLADILTKPPSPKACMKHLSRFIYRQDLLNSE